MDKEELGSITAAVLILFLISGFSFILEENYAILSEVLIFSFIVVFLPVLAKKWMAYSLDMSVGHKLWGVYRYGFKPEDHFRKEMPFGIILPVILALFTAGYFKLMTFLVYETSALKHRAAKRFGFYSYTEVTDWHNGLVGVAGVVSLLLIATLSYLPGLEMLSKMAAYYAVFNIIPLANLDGTQIFFGSRILWSVLAAICLIFAAYAFII